jgi:uncharacterized membrane protein HdeD (DUF308 family)
MVRDFLLGTICAASLVAALFFLRFWRTTRDVLFLAFAGFFLLEGLTSILQAVQGPSFRQWVFFVRLLGLILILAAIVSKNLKTD